MINTLAFEEYVFSKTGRTGGKPVVSIIGKGGFGFNVAFVTKHISEMPKFVSLNYAQDMNFIYIGFVFSVKRTENALKMYYPRSKNGMILCKGFFNKFGIDPLRYKNRYDFEQIDKIKPGKMFVIKLKK